MAEFSGQTNDSLSQQFLLRAFNVFQAAKNRACSTKYGSLPGVDLFWDLYFVYMYMRTSIAHMLWWVLMDVCFTSRMSVRWRNALWSLGVCFRAGFRVLWLRRRLLDVINAQHQQSRNQECPVLVKTDNHACMHARPKCMPVFLLLSSFKKCCFPAIPILLM